MDVENTFRVMFGIKKEQDMVELIEAAVSVAAMSVPQKLKKHRSRIVKLLFDEDPGNATQDLFSEDELGFDSDDDEDDDEFFKVTSPPKNTSHSPEIIKKLGFKKSVEEELSSQVTAPTLPPLNMVGHQDKSMEPTKKMLGRPQKDELLKVTSTPAKNTSHSPEIKKLGFKKVAADPPPTSSLMMVGRQDKSMEPTKNVLGRKNPKEEEEAEKKTAKKRKIDFPEPKKHCHNHSKAKFSGSYVRRLNATIKSIMN